MAHHTFFINLLSACLLLMTLESKANNVQVTNVSLTDQNTTDNFTMVEFDISWENSWRLAGGPANWDAAWVFVKYRVGSGNWQHAWINNTGHTAPSGSTISVGLLDPGAPFHNMTNPGMGVFIHRSGPGSGTFILANVKLRWNYGDNGLDDDAQVDIKVFAIEHVYVPEGAFSLGDNTTSNGKFYLYDPGLGFPPYSVDSEEEIPVGPTMGSLYYDLTMGNSGDQSGPIPSAFPKGFAAFYLMKYELSQQGYVDFLNTLSRPAQAENINSSFGASSFALANAASPLIRNGIRYPLGIEYSNPSSPAVFFCDLNNNNFPGDDIDGDNIPCNYVRLKFQLAYLDWAGLRPITEMEYEKACRGPLAPFGGEFAWGNIQLLPRTGFVNEGKADEAPSNPFENISSLYQMGTLAHIRCGGFATTTSDRTQSGAGYYGALELSGNLNELVVTAGSPFGRSFDGRHGNGMLDAGNADVVNWPDGLMGHGAGVRGGHYATTYTFCEVSNRYNAASIITAAQPHYGIRGGRTAAN